MAKDPFAYDLDTTNLDGMTPEDVLLFAAHLETLRQCAVAKYTATQLRLAGKISLAQTFEDQYDGHYEALPSNWQW